MPEIVKSHPLRTSVADFVEGLRALEPDVITQGKVLDYLSQVKLPFASLEPYIFWNDSYYTRNLIYRDELFEVMTLCWRADQKTPIHTHNGQLGWMQVVQGEVLTHQYRYLSCSNPENQNVIGLDCLGGSHNVELERLNTVSCADDGKVVTVDKLQTIHQIENADKAEAGCVSLHIYSKPIDSCVAFDLRSHRCGRRVLHYFSKMGVPVS
jgi:cysteine dioxygenase